jgi:hypothetical protein
VDHDHGSTAGTGAFLSEALKLCLCLGAENLGHTARIAVRRDEDLQKEQLGIIRLGEIGRPAHGTVGCGGPIGTDHDPFDRGGFRLWYRHSAHSF